MQGRFSEERLLFFSGFNSPNFRIDLNTQVAYISKIVSTCFNPSTKLALYDERYLGDKAVQLTGSALEKNNWGTYL